MTVLVTGATGTVGRQVVGELLERGERVRALTREPGRAGLPGEVEVVGGDLTEPEGLEGVFDGVSGVHLITFGGELFAPLETGERLVAMAEAAGVRRAAVLFGGAETPLQEAVCGSGLEWTVLMPVEFMANALEWAPDIRATSTVSEPFPGRQSAMVHERDIGACAAVALTEEGHAGRTYTLTGPEVLTVYDKAAAIGRARGDGVRVGELTAGEASERWRAAGMAEEVVGFLLEVYGDTPVEGRTVDPAVPRLLGRPALRFEEWAREHADRFTSGRP
ncbi:SDR family oxidoreductase [Streptomyces albidoflavus]